MEGIIINKTKLIYKLLSIFILSISFQTCTKEEVKSEDLRDNQEFVFLKKKLIAHRGYWALPGSAQNSLSSLQNAISLKVYGSEFDIRQTKDDSIVVCHDDMFDGLKISESTFLQLRAFRLKNGERLPTLYEFIQEAKQDPDFKLIVEIKQGNISKIVDMIEQCNASNQVEFLSFSLDYCKQLLNYNKGYKVSYLTGNTDARKFKEMGFYGIAYSYGALLQNPNLVYSADSLGLTTYVWTITDTKTLLNAIETDVDFIITDYLSNFDK